MKKILIFPAILFLSFAGFSQQQSNSQAAYSIGKEQLSKATALKDVWPGFPKGIVILNTDIVGTCNGKSIDDQFSTDSATDSLGFFSLRQIEIVKNADVGSKIYIDIKYRKTHDKTIRSNTFAIKVGQ